MKLASTNLSSSRSAFIEAELRQAAKVVASSGLPLPEVAITAVDLSAGGYELPERIRMQLHVDVASREERPGAFAARCAWEQQRQSYQILPNGPEVWIVGGGPEGVLYGVYRLLRDLTGLHWHGLADEDAVLESGPWRAQARRGVPDVPLRGFEGSLSKWNEAMLEPLFTWMARKGLNLMLFNAAQWRGLASREQVADAARVRGIRLVLGGHAPELFLPESLFDEHPEWFGLRDGRRCLRGMVEHPELAGGPSESPIQPCFSNPEVRDRMARAMAEFIDSSPELAIFSLWPHDGINNWCQCDGCRTSTPYAMLYRLALAILERTQRQDVPVEVLCYTNLLDLPRESLPPSDRIYTLFCPYLRDYRHSCFDPGFEVERLTLGVDYPEPEPVNPIDDREYGILLDRWLPQLQSTGSGLGIFAYYQLAFHDETGKTDRSRYLHHPEPDLVADELREFAKRGMQLFYDCSWPIPGFWPDARLYAYLPEVLWDLTTHAEDRVAAYYAATLGDQAQAVREILAELDAALADPDRLPLPPKLTAAARECFAKVPGPRGRRYLLWLEYVEMAERAWQLLKAGELVASRAQEEQIVAFFEAHREELSGHLLVPWMISTSRSAIRTLTGGTTRGAMPA